MTVFEALPRMAELLEARARHLEEVAALDRELVALMRRLPIAAKRVEGGTLSLRDLAEVLGVSYSTVYAMVRGGSIPAVRVGRQYRVPRSALNQVLTAGSEPA